MPDSTDWNLVVLLQQQGFRRVQAALSAFGVPHPTDYWNVLVMRVEDPRGFLEGLEALLEGNPGLAKIISRAVPVTCSFRFQSVEEFEQLACDAAREFVPALKGAAFHVRMHRRGFKERLSSQAEEQFLDHFLLEQLAAQAAPGRITFDDPDYIVCVETVGQRAGMSLWSREELKRFKLLGLD